MSDLKVVAVRRDADGNISKFKLNDNREISFNECRDMIHEGKLDMICSKGRSGATVIRTRPDSGERLSDLPTF